MSINEKIQQTILQWNNFNPNEYIYGQDMLSGFVQHAAKKFKITVKKHPEKNINYFYYHNKSIGHLTGLRSSSTRISAVNFCKNKYEVEKYLTKLSISTLQSKQFDESNKNEAYKYIKNQDISDYVIKPLSLSGGKGIHLNVNLNNFSEKWDNSFSVQNELGIENAKCLIQPYFEGFDLRVTIIEGRYNSAILRLPAHVIGDGNNSVLDLIEQKNDLRRKNPYFKNKLIPFNDQLVQRLKEENLTKETILDKDQVLILNSISNLTFGGESIDITDEVSDNIKESALHAVASIPGLYTAGVDIMTKDYISGEGSIIEINTSGNLSMHHLPLKGSIRYPYFSLLNGLLIKHKIANKIILNKTERKIYSEMHKFYQLKDFYSSKII